MRLRTLAAYKTIETSCNFFRNFCRPPAPAQCIIVFKTKLNLRSFRGTFLRFEFFRREPENNEWLPGSAWWFSSQTINIFEKSIKNGIYTQFFRARRKFPCTLIFSMYVSTVFKSHSNMSHLKLSLKMLCYLFASTLNPQVTLN